MNLLRFGTPIVVAVNERIRILVALYEHATVKRRIVLGKRYVIAVDVVLGKFPLPASVLVGVGLGMVAITPWRKRAISDAAHPLFTLKEFVRLLRWIRIGKIGIVRLATDGFYI